jgi:hypothetical protein
LLESRKASRKRMDKKIQHHAFDISSARKGARVHQSKGPSV